MCFLCPGRLNVTGQGDEPSSSLMDPVKLANSPSVGELGDAASAVYLAIAEQGEAVSSIAPKLEKVRNTDNFHPK
jgi:hypothetical protein